MFHSSYALAAFASLVLVCGFAIWKGGPAERMGASVIVLTWLVSVAAAALFKDYAVAARAYLASDAIMAVALLALAIRYSSLWMGAAMAVQSAVLILRAIYYADGESADGGAHRAHYYVLGQNLASVTLLLIILAATVAAIFARNRKPPSTAAGASAKKAGENAAGIVQVGDRKLRLNG